MLGTKYFSIDRSWSQPRRFIKWKRVWTLENTLILADVDATIEKVSLFGFVQNMFYISAGESDWVQNLLLLEEAAIPHPDWSCWARRQCFRQQKVRWAVLHLTQKVGTRASHMIHKTTAFVQTRSRATLFWRLSACWLWHKTACPVYSTSYFELICMYRGWTGGRLELQKHLLERGGHCSTF